MHDLSSYFYDTRDQMEHFVKKFACCKSNPKYIFFLSAPIISTVVLNNKVFVQKWALYIYWLFLIPWTLYLLITCSCERLYLRDFLLSLLQQFVNLPGDWYIAISSIIKFNGSNFIKKVCQWSDLVAAYSSDKNI